MGETVLSAITFDMANTLVFARVAAILSYTSTYAWTNTENLDHLGEADKLSQVLFELSELRTRFKDQEDDLSYLKDKTNLQEKLLKDINDEVEYLKELSKLQVVRTCEEMYNFGISQSNHYFIDPDGPLVGQEPIQVFCNFTEEGVFTEISHNSEEKTEVELCHDPGCYRRKIIYEAHPDQIQALIELSDSCDQNIRYDCLLSPLMDEGINLAFWLDKNGEEQVYWDGAHFGEHSCACHYSEEGCVEDATYQNKCNCDAKIPQEVFDEGKITNMTSLPISELRFGGLPYDIQQGFHTLGKLMCRGKPEEVKPDSCSALKLQGQFMSGYYNVKEENENSQLVFCNMSSSGYYAENSENFVSNSEDHFAQIDTEIEEINSSIPNLPGKWSGGSYCIFANGACPAGFTKNEGFMKHIWMEGATNDNAGFFKGAVFGDSMISCYR